MRALFVPMLVAAVALVVVGAVDPTLFVLSLLGLLLLAGTAALALATRHDPGPRPHY